eukprot:GEMP01016559.1.p1 GENE.GEMP01016559.1~~GEMP01016559.1.p1  ORF type:complete len:482 (+),score=126.49 GEMP01016559.1:178-1623(+)
MPSHLVMNGSPGCGLFMHVPEQRGVVAKLKVDSENKSEMEELRMEKKLRLMLEKKVSALSARLEKETAAKTNVEENLAALDEEVVGLRDCAVALSDTQESLNTFRREVDEMRHLKLCAERERKEMEDENRELKKCLAQAEKTDQGRVKRLSELQKEWTSQIDNLVMKETMLEREKEDLSAELESVKNEHETLLQHAQKLVGQYEVETEARLNLEERLAHMEETKFEKAAALTEVNSQHQQKSQRLEEENARLKEKIKRFDEDNTEFKCQVQALETNLAATKKDDVRVGRQIRVDKSQEAKPSDDGRTHDPRIRIGKQIRLDKPQEAMSSDDTFTDGAAGRSASVPRVFTSNNPRTVVTATACNSLGTNNPRAAITGASAVRVGGASNKSANAQRTSIPLVHNVARGVAATMPEKYSRNTNVPSAARGTSTEKDRIPQKKKLPHRGIGILEETKGRKLTYEDQLDREMRVAMDDVGYEENYD